MTKEQAKGIVNKLCFSRYIGPSDISAWLLDCKVYFDQPVSKMSLSVEKSLPQNFVRVTDNELEQYNDIVKQFCSAISSLWNVDRHTCRVVIERLMSLLTWTFTGMDCDIIRGKLSVLRLLSEI